MKTLILLVNCEVGDITFIEYIGDHSELDETNLEELDEEHELIRFLTEDDFNQNTNIRFLHEPSKDFDLFIKMYS